MTFVRISEPDALNGGRWLPQESTHLQSLLDQTDLSIGEAERVKEETRRILGRCVEPIWNRLEENTALVLGRVQSGKTLSFTSVCAAAIDNGFPLVIVLAGTKNNLLEQTSGRLEKDLSAAFEDSMPVILANPTATDFQSIHNRVLDFKMDQERLFSPQGTVLTVLKQDKRIRDLADLMKRISSAVQGSFPVLIIDDEADQAGLNTLHRKSEQSPVYAAIRDLRNRVPLHSYIMYTATPEAPLLLATSDTLAPETVTVLASGSSYIGGETLFRPGNSFVEIISQADIELAFDESEGMPPQSLHSALDYYLMLLCHGAHSSPQVKATMLIHPSSATETHARFTKWVDEYLKELKLTLAEEPDYRSEVLMKQFAPAYKDLEGRVQNSENLKGLDVYVRHLDQVLRKILVKTVNSTSGQSLLPQDWKRHHGVIVIGGNVLDRGFTVENLAVTYMPRGKGVGNADTIQQRGRFFGYRGKLAPFLRGWFPKEAADAFAAYADHEKLMRVELMDLDRQGLPLSDLKRRFYLKSSLVPTRNSVISANVVTLPMARSTWQFNQSRPFGKVSLTNDEHLDQIRRLFENSRVHQNDLRRDVNRRHRVAISSFGELLKILRKWKVSIEEEPSLEAVLFAAWSYIELTEPVELIDIDGWFSGENTKVRERTLLSIPKSSAGKSAGFGDGAQLNNLQQGQDPGTGNFPGDAKFRNPKTITVQFHRVRPKGSGLAIQDGTALSIALPDEVRGRVIIEVD